MGLKKILKLIFIFFLISYFLLDLYIYFKYKSEKNSKLLTWTTRAYSLIPNDSIPDNIISAYEKVFPGSLTNRIYPDIIWYLTKSRNNKNYIQFNLAHQICLTGGIEVISLANQLDNKLTQKQSLYAYLSKFDFGSNAIGMNEAAKIYYNKNIEELNEKESLELMVMTLNSSLFNKFRQPERLDKKVREIIEANTKQ